MSTLDWGVMLGTLLFIAAYGAWKTRKQGDLSSYLRGSNAEPWWAIGLSVMATQASAITFLSTPGQGFASGMGFVQFYFGLPLAMVIIAVFFIPIFYRLKVYTAYEYLEQRFDVKTRVLTASLFLIQRALAAGITIYAPAIILSKILGWGLNVTVLFIGIIVIIYTASGGTRAVTQTHKQQMAVIFTGMVITFSVLVWYLTKDLGFHETLLVAGQAGKMNIIDLDFDLGNRYTLWSGLIGGLFLQLSYFGTDQSQVQRYLGGHDIRAGRLGLMFNGILKIPMQFFILLTGVFVFVFYDFTPGPLYFNQHAVEQVAKGPYADELVQLEQRHEINWKQKYAAQQAWLSAHREGDRDAADRVGELLTSFREAELDARREMQELVNKTGVPNAKRDTDYIFISWVMAYLPIGMVGLLLAVIFSAAMSSTAAELNALASTATIDWYKRLLVPKATGMKYLSASRWATVFFGALAITFAMVASMFENLIQAVNILGSLFYGTILGIFVVAFFVKVVRSGRAIFIAALLSEALIILTYVAGREEWVIINGKPFVIEFLWLNFIGCALVVVLALVGQGMVRR
jgi:solute:Na+ symporter, SSS family